MIGSDPKRADRLQSSLGVSKVDLLPHHIHDRLNLILRHPPCLRRYYRGYPFKSITSTVANLSSPLPSPLQRSPSHSSLRRLKSSRGFKMYITLAPDSIEIVSSPPPSPGGGGAGGLGRGHTSPSPGTGARGGRPLSPESSDDSDDDYAFPTVDELFAEFQAVDNLQPPGGVADPPSTPTRVFNKQMSKHVGRSPKKAVASSSSPKGKGRAPRKASLSKVGKKTRSRALQTRSQGLTPPHVAVEKLMFKQKGQKSMGPGSLPDEFRRARAGTWREPSWLPLKPKDRANKTGNRSGPVHADPPAANFAERKAMRA
ncbi:hypothetical protein P7C70_g6715, partial [Phenoliferia sp. Uapishka_3]